MPTSAVTNITAVFQIMFYTIGISTLSLLAYTMFGPPRMYSALRRAIPMIDDITRGADCDKDHLQTRAGKVIYDFACTSSSMQVSDAQSSIGRTLITLEKLSEGLIALSKYIKDHLPPPKNVSNGRLREP